MICTFTTHSHIPLRLVVNIKGGGVLFCRFGPNNECRLYTKRANIIVDCRQIFKTFNNVDCRLKDYLRNRFNGRNMRFEKKL